jgi:hypothetical protein
MPDIYAQAGSRMDFSLQTFHAKQLDYPGNEEQETPLLHRAILRWRFWALGDLGVVHMRQH